jgi:multisubunit Na+/H+ antiporter MnhE subunit
MWALTIMNLLMLWAVLTRRMEVDVELFAYMSGMIVALYFFREVLPDAPPFLGVFADYAAFFWAELITAACSVIFALIWYRQLIKSPPGVTTPPWGERGA